MPKTLLIIITGLPGTGKTTLGRKIAQEFSLPFISKDEFKEALFDELGWSDREWSRKLGMASYKILYKNIESLLSANVPCIVESNFKPEFDNEKFLELKKKYDFIPLQIMCKTEGEILFERFKFRVESGERHPGHCDMKNGDEFKDFLLNGRLESLTIGGEVVDIDTTDFNAIDYDKLFRSIKAVIEA